MYGDQFGEFVCGYWILKGQSFGYNSNASALLAPPVQTPNSALHRINYYSADEY